MTEIDQLGGAYPWLPDPGWEELRPFWDAARRGELRFPCCGSCGRFQWYPQVMCPACQSMAFDWVEVPPTGRLFTHTVLRRSFIPAFDDRLPLIIALVKFDAARGVNLVTNVVDADPGDLEIGQAVSIVFREVSADVSLPFALIGSSQ